MNKYLSSPFLRNEKTVACNPSKVRNLKSEVILSHLTGNSFTDELPQINEALIRYKPTPVQSETPIQPSNTNTCSDSSQRNTQNVFRTKKPLEPLIHKACIVVSDKRNIADSISTVEHINKINQLSFLDSFNYVDLVAVTGNNLKQEPRKLPVSVSHHTLVDVFLCLSFANSLFTGELRLALALVRLWWGGHGNKPFIGRIPCAVLQRFSSLPTALTLGQITKTSLPLEKVL